ncbi:MarR family winged helix-turn-helix transcriptional regulator [Kineosporia babensis]|nr:MarR family transcriptional regulator [Kineosporia babensis]
MDSADGVSGSDDFQFAPMNWSRGQRSADERPRPRDSRPRPEAEPESQYQSPNQPEGQSWADQQPESWSEPPGQSWAGEPGQSAEPGQTWSDPQAWLDPQHEEPWAPQQEPWPGPQTQGEPQQPVQPGQAAQVEPWPGPQTQGDPWPEPRQPVQPGQAAQTEPWPGPQTQGDPWPEPMPPAPPIQPRQAAQPEPMQPPQPEPWSGAQPQADNWPEPAPATPPARPVPQSPPEPWPGPPQAGQWSPENDQPEPEVFEEPEAVTAEQPPDPLAESELTYLLRMALQTVRAETTAELVAVGLEELRPLDNMVFTVLQERGGLTVEDLAEALSLTAPEAVQLTKTLEKRGYLRRTPGPRGARHPLYVVNSKAQQYMRAAGYVQVRQEARLVERLGEDGVAELRTRLTQLIRAQTGDDVPPLRPTW